MLCKFVLLLPITTLPTEITMLDELRSLSAFLVCVSH